MLFCRPLFINQQAINSWRRYILTAGMPLVTEEVTLTSGGHIPARESSTQPVCSRRPMVTTQPAEACQQSIYQCIVNISWSGLDITIRGSLSVMLFREQSNLRYQVVCLWVRVSFEHHYSGDVIFSFVWAILSYSERRSPKSCGQKY